MCFGKPVKANLRRIDRNRVFEALKALAKWFRIRIFRQTEESNGKLLT